MSRYVYKSLKIYSLEVKIEKRICKENYKYYYPPTHITQYIVFTSGNYFFNDPYTFLVFKYNHYTTINLHPSSNSNNRELSLLILLHFNQNIQNV